MHMQMTDVVDIAASLGLIVVLGYAYAQLHHRLQFPKTSQLVLGALFGLAAIVQMVRPFEPMEGLIIDFRNIPIAIAGAFLGVRGALTCLCLAVAMRLNLGGIGMWAGVLGMVLTMSGGAFWAWWTKSAEKRGFGAMVCLALAMSIHLAAALILPEAARAWFLSQAALPLLIVNLTTIPLVGSILEGERFRHKDKRRLDASAVFDPDTGLLNLESFKRQCVIRAVALDDGSYTQVLVLRLRLYPLMSTWGRPAQRKQLLAAMKMRVEASSMNVDIACCYGDRSLLVPLSLEDLARRDEILVEIRRAVTEAPYIHANTEHHASVDLHILPLTEDTDIQAALDGLSPRMVTAAEKQRDVENSVPQGNFGPKPYKSSTDKMFAKLDVLLNQSAIFQKSN